MFVGSTRPRYRQFEFKMRFEQAIQLGWRAFAQNGISSVENRHHKPDIKRDDEQKTCCRWQIYGWQSQEMDACTTNGNLIKL